MSDASVDTPNTVAVDAIVSVNPTPMTRLYSPAGVPIQVEVQHVPAMVEAGFRLDLHDVEDLHNTLGKQLKALDKAWGDWIKQVRDDELHNTHEESEYAVALQALTDVNVTCRNIHTSLTERYGVKQGKAIRMRATKDIGDPVRGVLVHKDAEFDADPGDVERFKSWGAEEVTS